MDEDEVLHRATWRIKSTPQDVSRLRVAIKDEVRPWGIPLGDDLRFTLLLLASELVTNAFRYGTQEFIDVVVSATCSKVSVRVTDGDGQGAGRLIPESPSLHAEAGRGLVLVAALATGWAVELTDGGKAVTADLALTRQPPKGRNAEASRRQSTVSCGQGRTHRVQGLVA